jgi:hypothetical protein
MRGLLRLSMIALVTSLPVAWSGMIGNTPSGIRTPLTSIAVVTSLDVSPDPEDPGAGGGFDAETYFREALVSKIGDCTKLIEAEFATWSQLQGFVIPKKERSPAGLLVHATKIGFEGLFELVYRVDPKRERARVTVYYYSNDGVQHEPLGIKMLLDGYGIAALQDKLETALQCQGKVA